MISKATLRTDAISIRSLKKKLLPIFCQLFAARIAKFLEPSTAKASGKKEYFEIAGVTVEKTNISSPTD